MQNTMKNINTTKLTRHNIKGKKQENRMINTLMHELNETKDEPIKPVYLSGEEKICDKCAELFSTPLKKQTICDYCLI